MSAYTWSNEEVILFKKVVENLDRTKVTTSVYDAICAAMTEKTGYRVRTIGGYLARFRTLLPVIATDKETQAQKVFEALVKEYEVSNKTRLSKTATHEEVTPATPVEEVDRPTTRPGETVFDELAWLSTAEATAYFGFKNEASFRNLARRHNLETRRSPKYPHGNLYQRDQVLALRSKDPAPSPSFPRFIPPPPKNPVIHPNLHLTPDLRAPSDQGLRQLNALVNALEHGVISPKEYIDKVQDVLRG